MALALAMGVYLLFAVGDDPGAEAVGEGGAGTGQTVTELPPPLPTPDATPDEPGEQAPEPDANERFRMNLAAEELVAIRRFLEEHPDEREEAYFRIWKLMERYSGTPAAAEAREWWNTLDVPEDFSAQAQWHQAWAASGELPRVQFHEEWDRRHFVYETRPPSAHDPIRLSRKLTVPEDRPFLTCPVRGHDEGDCEVWMEVNGQASARLTARGGAWQDLALDLSAFKDREVDVSLVHQATGWANEYAFWQMPRFVAHAPAGTATAALLTTDVAQAPRTTADEEEEETEIEELEVNWKRALDLLALVRPEDDTVTGEWRMEKGELCCDRTSPARLVFPYRPPDEYAVRVTFTVKEHAEAVTLLLSRGGKNFTCVMGGWNNTVCGFALVNGGNASGNPTTVRKDHIFTIDQRHTMVVHVRKRGLKAFLDNRLMCQLRTDYGNVSADPGWNPDPARLLWLGLGTWDTQVLFHSAEIAELSGKGKYQRLPNGVLASALPDTERGVMARWLGELRDLMRGERFAEARQRLRELKSETGSGAIKTALDRDTELLVVAEALLKRSLDGFARLTDHRNFVLWRTNGTRLPIGEKDGNRVLGVADGRIEIEMQAGAGKVVQRVALDHFSPRSQVDAAFLVLPRDDSTRREQALGAVLRYREGADAPPIGDIRGQLDALAKAAGGAPLAERLRAWLEHAERERKAKADFESLKTTLSARSAADFERAVKSFEDAHRETATYAQVLPELRKLKDDFGRLPGLWAMYYAGDAKSKFRRFHGARAEGRSVLDWGGGSPYPGVPADFFGIRFRGALRAPKDGVYEFRVAADDELEFRLDGHTLCFFVGNKEARFALRLCSGEHDVRIYYAEHVGAASLKLHWKPPGARDFSGIPASALVHRPSSVESYQKE